MITGYSVHAPPSLNELFLCSTSVLFLEHSVVDPTIVGCGGEQLGLPGCVGFHPYLLFLSLPLFQLTRENKKIQKNYLSINSCKFNQNYFIKLALFSDPGLVVAEVESAQLVFKLDIAHFLPVIWMSDRWPPCVLPSGLVKPHPVIRTLYRVDVYIGGKGSRTRRLSFEMMVQHRFAIQRCFITHFHHIAVRYQW